MAKKYIDADLLLKEVESRMGDCDANSKNPNQLLWAELAALIPFIESLQQQTDGILNSYIEQRSKELDAIIQEEMTPDNTVTIADKIGAMTAKNELLRIKELI